MIAPRIVSHVQPSGRDYSGTTSPDLITEVPIPSSRAEDVIRREMEEIYGEERTGRILGEAGRATVGWALLTLVTWALVGLLLSLAFLGAPPSGAAYRECIDAFQTEIGAVTAMDELDCRDGLADGNR